MKCECFAACQRRGSDERAADCDCCIMHQFIISRGPNLNCRLPPRWGYLLRDKVSLWLCLRCERTHPLSFVSVCVRMINNSGEDNFLSIQGERAAAPPLNG
jgi:hypothetical protein